MEAVKKDKEKTSENKRKFSFGDLKIRNKIIFGFFIVSIISGLVNYYSNSFIVSEFRTVNNTMHTFHNVFAMQKRLEIMVESYAASEFKGAVSDLEFAEVQNKIGQEFGHFMQKGGAFLDRGLVDRFISESNSFYEKESEVVLIHKEEIEGRLTVEELEAHEKDLRYSIRDYVDALKDRDIYEAFLYAEYASKEMLYQYRDSEHAAEWLSALENANNVAAGKYVEIPGFSDYYDTAKRTSDAVVKLESIGRRQQSKLEEFRFAIEDLNLIQDEVSKEITNQNISEINAIIVVGVFIFIFILMFFTVFLGYMVSIFISRPIKELADFAFLASKGNFQHRIRISTSDEIGQTAKAFNQMLDKVEESTEVLEIKVNARTKRLEELSQNLETQINNKTKELNEKIGELERFNDLAIGRELRMVELKREIEILRQGGGIVKKAKAEGKQDKKMNCWDFWKCSEETKKKCPAFLTNSGRECWVVSAGKCPRSKERGIEDCRECAWYVKINK